MATCDDAGIVAQWTAVPEPAAGAAPGAAPGAAILLARHDAGGGAPATSVALVPGGALAAAYADGMVRVFGVGAPGGGGGGGGGVPSRAAAAAAGRFLCVDVAAHARACTALAAHPTIASFASVGEDGLVCVWALPELAARRGGGGGAGAPGGVGALVLSLAARAPALRTGVAFFWPPGAPGAAGAGLLLATAAYDAPHLLLHKSH
jgi:hypothetical protein